MYDLKRHARNVLDCDLFLKSLGELPLPSEEDKIRMGPIRCDDYLKLRKKISEGESLNRTNSLVHSVWFTLPKSAKRGVLFYVISESFHFHFERDSAIQWMLPDTERENFLVNEIAPAPSKTEEYIYGEWICFLEAIANCDLP